MAWHESQFNSNKFLLVGADISMVGPGMVTDVNPKCHHARTGLSLPFRAPLSLAQSVHRMSRSSSEALPAEAREPPSRCDAAPRCARRLRALTFPGCKHRCLAVASAAFHLMTPPAPGPAQKGTATLAPKDRGRSARQNRSPARPSESGGGSREPEVRSRETRAARGLSTGSRGCLAQATSGAYAVDFP